MTLTSTLSMADPTLSYTTNTRKSVMHEDSTAEFESLTFYITMFHSTAPYSHPCVWCTNHPSLCYDTYRQSQPTPPGQIPGRETTQEHFTLTQEELSHSTVITPSLLSSIPAGISCHLPPLPLDQWAVKQINALISILNGQPNVTAVSCKHSWGQDLPSGHLFSGSGCIP